MPKTNTIIVFLLCVAITLMIMSMTKTHNKLVVHYNENPKFQGTWNVTLPLPNGYQIIWKAVEVTYYQDDYVEFLDHDANTVVVHGSIICKRFKSVQEALEVK